MRNAMTPDTGSEHFYLPLILRGIGLGLLFVPITTLSLSTLKGKNIGEGAAFTGMMRQLGGSFGIAIITTYITRLTQKHRIDLIPHLDSTRLEVQQRIIILQRGFMSKGFSENEALKKAHQVLEYSVLRQSTVMSYMDIFMYLGVVFLCCIPIILLIKRGKTKINPADAMH
jgi:DHA2 family multidrug resistance protein